jgi:hypothetical protein
MTNFIFYDAQTSSNAQAWQTADDRVMGGVSVAHVDARTMNDAPCMCLTGDVSTENRGGFIQMKWTFDDMDASAYQGVMLDVLGNGETYNIHIRTNQLWLPWQSFRASFDTNHTWQSISIPFSAFENYKTWSTLDASRIRKVAVVAIGKDFKAEVCVRKAGFYR